MRKLVVLIMALLTTVVLFSCSSGSKITRDLLISSDPAGATVYMDGDRIGETPLKLQTFFTWNNDHPYDSLLRRVIQVTKEGYVPQTRDLYPIDMPHITFFLNHENTSDNVKGEEK
jgi:hypothetical protein